MAVNQVSRRVMEKIGVKHSRTDFPKFSDPIPGTEHGEVSYELTRLDWLAINGRPVFKEEPSQSRAKR